MAEKYVPEVTRVDVGGRTMKLSSLSKIMYPSTETTKDPRSLWLRCSALWPPFRATPSRPPDPGAGRPTSTPASSNQLRNGDSPAAAAGTADGTSADNLASAAVSRNR